MRIKFSKAVFNGVKCMMMSTNNILVEIFTVPQAACDEEKANWEKTAGMVKGQIEKKFGDAADVKHIEFMSDEWFNHTTAQQILEKGEINFPFVLVNGEIACDSKKINIPRINRKIESIIK